jgi:fructoselysine 6-kinase
VAVARLSLGSVGDNCIDRYVPPVRPDTVGGNALNVAVGFVRAGHAARYLGAVGDDEGGRLVLEAASSAGVEVDGVQALPAPTGVTTVELLPDGDRRFLDESYGASALYRLDEDGVTRLRGCSWVHAANLAGATEAIPRLAAAGHTLSYDFSDHEDNDLRRTLCPVLQVAFFSAPEASDAEAGALADAAVSDGAAIAVVTRGAAGSLAAAGGEGYLLQEALPVRVVDTLGAGDAFIAAFIASSVAGAATAEALQDGAEAAARTCENVGPWPTAKEVRA